MLYLEGMQKAPPDDGEKTSSVRSSRMRSPPPKGSMTSSARRLEELAEENVDYDGHGNGGEDIRSDVQEGNGSDMARTIPIHTTGLVSARSRPRSTRCAQL